jgi:hypothetical protein
MAEAEPIKNVLARVVRETEQAVRKSTSLAHPGFTPYQRVSLWTFWKPNRYPSPGTLFLFSCLSFLVWISTPVIKFFLDYECGLVKYSVSQLDPLHRISQKGWNS